MTIRECYQMFGGDYEDIFGRFGSPRMVQKFLLKFPQDTSFAELTDALEKQDYETAFRAAHTLKGVCLNLSMTQLYESSHAVTEALRPPHQPQPAVLEELMKVLTEDYTLVLSSIRKFSDE